MTFIFKSRTLLQIAIAVAACVPVFAGGYGLFYDVGINSIQPVLSDNHIHYLSGLLLDLFTSPRNWVFGFSVSGVVGIVSLLSMYKAIQIKKSCK